MVNRQMTVEDLDPICVRSTVRPTLRSGAGLSRHMLPYHTFADPRLAPFCGPQCMVGVLSVASPHEHIRKPKSHHER